MTQPWPEVPYVEATGAPREVINEIRYGGATYVSTGRGLPTDRRPFIGEAVPGKLLIIANDECCTQFIFLLTNAMTAHGCLMMLIYSNI